MMFMLVLNNPGLIFHFGSYYFDWFNIDFSNGLLISDDSCIFSGLGGDISVNKAIGY